MVVRKSGDTYVPRKTVMNANVVRGFKCVPMNAFLLGLIIPRLTSWMTPLRRQATVDHVGVSRRQECLGRVIFLPDQSRHEDSESVAGSLPHISMTHSLLYALLFSDVVFTGRTTIHFDKTAA